MELEHQTTEGTLSSTSPLGFSPPGKKLTVLTLFGTRPEAIKVAPVISELEARGDRFRTVNVNSGQHTDLLAPFVELFALRIDHDLGVMVPDQSPSGVCARVLTNLDQLLELEKPDLILVQGDTSTALSGALAGFHRRIPVGHIEAGLRSGDPNSPFPEEMNRRLISKLASVHFAATTHNRDLLLSEGVSAKAIFVTGNPVVDSLHRIVRTAKPAAEVRSVLDRFALYKLIVLTTHRRESLGAAMMANLRALREFIEHHEDVALVFPVHLNPMVGQAARSILAGHDRIQLLPPLGYPEFLALLRNAWLVVSDSGGVQEEAPSLGKPLLVLRENTERPEAIESGVARLVGSGADSLAAQLDEAYRSPEWVNSINEIPNPFGNGDSGPRIVDAIEMILVLTADAGSAARVTIPAV
ncbi:MAG: UDP-N-acetylglucosamine 2-epimerase (non-hydrolyzing) [Pyrinomonadaceae bacterium]